MSICVFCLYTSSRSVGMAVYYVLQIKGVYTAGLFVWLFFLSFFNLIKCVNYWS